MIICRDYNEDARLDRVWYKSSNVIYSECDDLLNENKTLRVTFKDGSTYQYKDVDVNDYLLFIKGGLDGSNGRALFKYIKPKYEFEKLESKNLEELDEQMNEILKKKNPEVKEDENVEKVE